ncbi:hypothetical protein K523DRAFT_367217 [Schizophyllum commune Tattone D]|nr:hypothetical protein K523DRAFT_367217 [Schizophyllum commune Tattone D]
MQYTVATGLAAANSGLTAATFFSLRELVIRPLLRDHIPPPSTVRRENLIESGLSGALTGGLLRGIRSGPPAAVSGALILGTLTTSLQYAFNAVRASPPPSSSASIPTSSYDPTSPVSSNTSPAPKTPTHRLTDALLALFGVYPITLEEQIASLKRKRDAHVRKIREIEERLGLERDEGLGLETDEGLVPEGVEGLMSERDEGLGPEGEGEGKPAETKEREQGKSGP